MEASPSDRVTAEDVRCRRGEPCSLRRSVRRFCDFFRLPKLMPPIGRRPPTGRGISHVVDEERLGAPLEKLLSMPFHRGQRHVRPLLKKLSRVFPDEAMDRPLVEANRAEGIDDRRIHNRMASRCPRRLAVEIWASTKQHRDSGHVPFSRTMNPKEPQDRPIGWRSGRPCLYIPHRKRRREPQHINAQCPNVQPSGTPSVKELARNNKSRRLAGSRRR